MNYYTFKRGDFDIARAKEARMKSLHLGSKNTYWSKPDKDLIGALGEIAFERYLAAIGADFEAHAEHTGFCGDLWDYCLKDNGKRYYFDVKGSTRYETATANEKQAAKAAKFPNLLLVAVKVVIESTIERGGRDSGRAQIIGYAPASWLARTTRTFADPKSGEQIAIYEVPSRRLLRFKVDELVIY